jgi:hypothetical protein
MTNPIESDPARTLAASLTAHLQWCYRALEMVTRENAELATGCEPAWESFREKRKDLLTELDTLVKCLRTHRLAWGRLTPGERARDIQVPALLRSNTDLIMRIVLLDRENEQLLLRRGLLPPVHLPSANRQRPHFVTELYRRTQAG